MRAMNESDARTVLFVRAFEAEPQAGWNEADAAWASREAARTLGEQAVPEALIAERARLAFARMVERRPALRGLHAASGWPAWANAALPLLAFAAGLATDAIGSSGRINLLAPPLFGLLRGTSPYDAVLAPAAWARLRSHGGARARPCATRSVGPLHSAARRFGQRAEFAAPAAARFTADWLAAGGRLNAARVGALLHAGAGAVRGRPARLALPRGIAFEYRAGWDSTFLRRGGAPRRCDRCGRRWAERALAARRAAARRAALSGRRGENAARWIAPLALTAALVVLLPRGLLGGVGRGRARRLAAHIELPLHEAYFQRLLRAQRGAARGPGAALQLPAAGRSGGRARGGARARARRAGRPAARARRAARRGRRPGAWPPLVAGALPVALFALTATPERRAMASSCAGSRRARRRARRRCC